MIPSISESDRKRKRARARSKWLDACTDYDYEREHNLIRRSGNTVYFLDESGTPERAPVMEADV